MQLPVAIFAATLFASAFAANSLTCYEGYSFYGELPSTKAEKCFTCKVSVIEYKGALWNSKLTLWIGEHCETHPDVDWNSGVPAYVKPKIENNPPDMCNQYNNYKFPDTTTTVSTTTTTTTTTTSTTTTTTEPPTKCSAGHTYVDNCASPTDQGYRTTCTCCSDNCNSKCDGTMPSATDQSSSNLLTNLTCHAGWSFDGSTPSGEMTGCRSCIKYVKKIEDSAGKRAITIFEGVGCTIKNTMPDKEWNIYDGTDMSASLTGSCYEFYVPNNMATTTPWSSTTTTTTTTTSTTSGTTAAPMCYAPTIRRGCVYPSDGTTTGGAAAGCACCTNKCNTKDLKCEASTSTDPNNAGGAGGSGGGSGSASSVTSSALATVSVAVFASVLRF